MGKGFEIFQRHPELLRFIRTNPNLCQLSENLWYDAAGFIIPQSVIHEICPLPWYKRRFPTAFMLSPNTILTSCPWGLVTANGVDLLTDIYVILAGDLYSTYRTLIQSGHALTNGKLGNIYRCKVPN